MNVNYSKLGIMNMAVGKLGSKRIIASLTENTDERIAATTVWDYILDEVLEAKGWHFAKTRTRIHRVDVIPAFGFSFAYIIPDDFLKFLYPKPDYPAIYPSTYDSTVLAHAVESMLIPDGLEKVTNGTFTGAATGWTLGAQWAYGSNKVAKVVGGVTTLSQLAAGMVSAPVADEIYLLDFEVSGLSGGSIIPSIGGTAGTPVSEDGDDNTSQHIQAINATGALIFTPSASGVVCSIDNVSVLKCLDKLALLIDYEDSDDYPLYIGYIRRVIDPTRYSATFVKALAFRLAAEMALKLTEGMAKYNANIQLYGRSLAEAEAVTQSMDSIPNETGSTDWVDAGR